MITIHISRERMDALKSQAYGVRKHPEPPTAIGLHPKSPGDDVEFHILDGERAHCLYCNEEQSSVDVSTPADLENLKWQMRSKTNA